MVFVFIIRYVLAAGLAFLSFFITAPLVYNVWHTNLRPIANTGTSFSSGLVDTGDVFFGSFLILSFIVPGIIIAWGFIVAQRKRVQETTRGFT